MSALTARADVARTRAHVPSFGRAVAQPRRLRALPPQVAAKRALVSATAAKASPKMSDADVARVAGVMMQKLLKKEDERDAAVAKLQSTVNNKAKRVQALEQELKARKAAEAAEKQAERAAERNRARQLNPACKAFWTSRGWSSVPWTWEDFADTKLEHAHEWSSVMAAIKQVPDYDDWHLEAWWGIQRYSDASDTLYEIISDPTSTSSESLHTDAVLACRKGCSCLFDAGCCTARRRHARSVLSLHAPRLPLLAAVKLHGDIRCSALRGNFGADTVVL